MRIAFDTSPTLTRAARATRLRALGLIAACSAGVYVLACSAEAPNDPIIAGSGAGGGSGGSGTTGGAGGSTGGTSTNAGAPGGGGAATGGSSAGSGALAGRGGTGGGNLGGATAGGSGGRATTGGTGPAAGTGSGPGGRDGSGGSSAGAGAAAGSGTTGGTDGSGGSVGTPKPSAGCGKGARPSGGQVQVANQSIYKFPADYDGTKPYPLLIAIHACGNPNTEFVSITDKTDFDTGYVRSFPNTPDSGQCWSNYAGDVARLTSQYDELTSTYCIDENRVFAIAHSSGAQLLVNILSHKSDADHLNLKGISPVAADPYNVALPMPVLYIDGKNDNQRSADSAKNTVAKFRASNSCMDSSKPYTPVMACNSTESGHPAVDPGCIVYDDCAVPTIWCSHNDPSYSGTEHGIPCFAIPSMIDFFASL